MRTEVSEIGNKKKQIRISVNTKEVDKLLTKLIR